MAAASVQFANGAKCICGNSDPVKFREYYDREEHLGPYCLKCEREYIKKDFFLDSVSKDEDKVLELHKEKFYQAERLDTTDSGVHMVHPKRQEIKNLDRFGDYLKPGDHIAWKRPYLIWHHALVLRVDVEKCRVQVIHWHGRFKFDATIKEEPIDLKKELGVLYRIDYEKEELQENPIQLVIARARSRLGDDGYRLFGDNCEAFVTYCKRGVAKSQQVHWVWKGLTDRVKTTLCDVPVKFTRKGLKIVQSSFVDNATKVIRAEGIEKIAKNCQWVGFGLVVFCEGYTTYYDLKKLYEARKDGSLTRKDFMEQVAKRPVIEAICAGVPAAFGGLTPGFGGIFVGIIVGTLGKITGACFGQHLGRAITAVFKPDDRAVTSIKELHTGDQIVFYGHIVHPRHHCIVLWHDEEKNKVNVIHNTYEYGVRQEWIKFVPPFYKVIHEEDKCHAPDKVCSRAISKLGVNEYNLVNYNCKHFAEWCKKKN